MTENSEEATGEGSKGNLSIRRQRFCEMMLVCSSATKAAIAAGYSERSAHVTACRMLKDANVQAEITRLWEIAAEKADITAVKILYGLKYDIDIARELGHSTAVMAGWKMLGQHLSMWKDSLEIRPLDDNALHQDFAALALSGASGDRVLARRIFRGFIRKIGSDDVFGPPISDEDIDALLDGATKH